MNKEYYIQKKEGTDESMGKKASKILFLMMAILILVVGCSNNKSQPSGGTKTEPSEQTNKGNENSKEEELYTEVGTYPIVTKPITMKMFLRTVPNIIDYSTNEFTKFMEETTGIKWEFETATSDAVQEKINLLMVSKDFPDAFMFDTPDEGKFGVEEKLLYPIGDLIEKNMPNYMEVMKAFPDIKGRTTATDGEIYNLGIVNQCYHCTYAQKMWVNTMWLEKMGMKEPTTTEEFIEVCKKFLEINPGGIAVAGSIDGWHQDFIPFLTNAFILDPGYSTDPKAKTKIVLSPDGKLDTIVNKPEYQEAMRFLNELYKIGAIYEGSFTQNSGSLRNLLSQADEPVLFVPAGTISDLLDSSSNNEAYRHYKTIAPLEGPSGLKQVTYFKHSGIGSRSFTLTKTCKYPEAALRWADFFYTFEGTLTSQFGFEGKDWVRAEKGDIGLNGEPALYKILTSYSSEPQNLDWQDVAIGYRPSVFRLGEATDPNVDVGAPEGLEALLIEETKRNYEPHPQKAGNYDVLPAIKLLEQESSDIQTITVELGKYIEEMRVAFITGGKDIDKHWDEYIKGLENLGLEKYLTVYRGAYDRQYK